MYDPNLGRHLVRSGGLNEYQAQALPYTVLSSMGKGFLNAAAGSVVGTLDLALTVAQLSPMTLSFGQPIYHIPDKFYTPFTVGNSQIERMAAAEGEFGFYALDAYLGASGAIRGGFSAARQELGMARRLGNCFVAGTPVQMANGTTRPIEQVKVGDFVKSRNPKTGQVEAKRVDRTYVRVAPQVQTLTFADVATHQTQAFTCTPEHPFLVDGRGFVRAEDLGIGTSIVTHAGPALTLSAVVQGAPVGLASGTGLALGGQAHPAGITVYNLRVEDDHTYFVGTLSGGTCVHNANYEIFERFGSEAEAVEAQEAQKLTQRPGHPNGEKWISDVGEIKRPQGLGQDVTHRMEIKASPGTREWLRRFEIKTNEPNRYAVPADKLGEFNARINSISTKRFRLMGRQMRRR